MRRAPDKLYDLIKPVVTGLGYELVGMEFAAGKGNGLLRIYIDNANGIDLDDCQTVSYQISGLLDVEDPVPGQYNLEVSSPGLDRPLFEKVHFDRFAGSLVRLRTQVPHNGRKKFQGILHGMEGELVVIEQDGETVKLPFTEVEQAKLVPEFD